MRIRESLLGHLNLPILLEEAVEELISKSKITYQTTVTLMMKKKMKKSQ